MLLWAGGFFFCLSFFSSFVPWWDPLVYHYRPLWVPLLLNIYVFTYQKKKKVVVTLGTLVRVLSGSLDVLPIINFRGLVGLVEMRMN